MIFQKLTIAFLSLTFIALPFSGAVAQNIPAKDGASNISMMPKGVPQNGERRYQIFMDGQPIGMHSLLYHHNAENNTTTVKIHITMDVQIAFVTLYSYSHRNTEVWRDGKLISLDTQTTDGGDTFDVTARRNEQGGLSVSANGPDGGLDYVVPAEDMILTTSYWQRRTIDQSQLLNTQNGKLINVTITPEGTKSLEEKPDGLDILADQYRVTGELEATFWYATEDTDVAQKNEWVGLHFPYNGRNFTYKLLD